MARLSILFLLGFSAVFLVGTSESTVILQKLLGSHGSSHNKKTNIDCQFELKCLLELLGKYEKCNLELLIKLIINAGSCSSKISNEELGKIVAEACSSANCKGSSGLVILTKLISAVLEVIISIGVLLTGGWIKVDLFISLIGSIFLGIPLKC